MKKWILALMMLAGLALLAGCAGRTQPPSSRYIVVTEAYAIHIATTQPVVDAHAETISFSNENGEKVSIMRNSLKEIKEFY